MIQSAAEILGIHNKKPTYSDKLKDPRWVDRRKSYLSKNGYWCRSCKQADVLLNVHHLAYDGKREPWEYHDHELTAFCKSCHERWHKIHQSFRYDVAAHMPVMALQMIVGVLKLLIQHHSATDVAYAMAQMASEPETFRRLRIAWKAGEEKK
jgi:hypothetical protein